MNSSQFGVLKHAHDPFDRLRVDCDKGHSDRGPPGVEPTVGISSCRNNFGVGKGFHDVLKLEIIGNEQEQL